MKACSEAAVAEATATVRARLGDRLIVLVGLMGAGKTTVGKRMAQRLALPFIDADAEIEAAAGMTIPEIFAAHGEDYFRDGERRVILRLLANGPSVLATGGGAYMNAETRAAIARRGIALWLRADLDVLMARVRRKANRPLLRNADPEGVMRRLMAERYPVYAQANVTVTSRDVPHDEIACIALIEIARYLAAETGKVPAGPRPVEG